MTGYINKVNLNETVNFVIGVNIPGKNTEYLARYDETYDEYYCLTPDINNAMSFKSVKAAFTAALACNYPTDLCFVQKIVLKKPIHFNNFNYMLSEEEE